MTDPVLDALLAEAADDPGTLGLLLTGSRSAGLEDESSDYDPAEQRRLQARVERLMESRGVLAHREWGHALADAKQGS